MPELKKRVALFEKAWRQAWQHAEGTPANIDMNSFLPSAADPLRLPTLHQLIRVDLEIRWALGQGVALEFYLPRFPELGSVRKLPAELILHEYNIRHLHGDRPELEFYRARFPEQFPHLLRMTQDPPSGSPGTVLPSSPIPPLPDPVPYRVASPNAFEEVEQVGFDPFPPSDEPIEVPASTTPFQALASPVPVERRNATVRPAPVAPRTQPRTPNRPGRGEAKSTDQPAAGAPRTQPHTPHRPASGEANATVRTVAGIPRTEPHTPNPPVEGPAARDPFLGGLSPGTPHANAVLPIGGGYRLLKKLGSGTFGEVWKAESMQGGTEVAIKIIKCSVDESEAQQELKALEVVKKLRHPYLVQTQFFSIWHNRLYIVIDLADGSLIDRAAACLENDPPGIPTEELLRYIAEAAEALDYLHSEQVHHRDIKPANILLLKDHARLADFGLARSWQTQASMIVATASGTPAYMPPEVWQSKISSHSDQWSLAATYGELRLNRRLYKARNNVGLMAEICNNPPDLTGLLEAEQQVLLKAMAISPRDRYATCSEFARALREAMRPQGNSLKHEPRRWRLAAGLLCLLSLLVFAAGMWWVNRPPVSPPGYQIEVTEPEPFFVDTGRTTSITLDLHRDGFTGPVRISCLESDLPAGVKVPSLHLAADADQGTLDIEVSQEEAVPHATPHKVTLIVEGLNGNDAVVYKNEKARLRFTVVYLPARFEKLSDEHVRDGNGIYYYKRIQFSQRDPAIQIPFVLIPQNKRQEDENYKQNPPTFYIMKDKVSLQQFREFARKSPKEVNPAREWDKGKDPGHPVFNVTVEEAYAFAKWLCSRGKLPTVGQWEKAAGCYEKPLKGEGPYKETWNKSKKIAIGRQEPMRLDAADDDVSEAYGCRNMSGNGDEWTRSLNDRDRDEFVPHRIPPHNVFFYGRGCSFRVDHPIRYDELRDKPKPLFKYGEFKPELSFRVVIEP